MMASLWTMTEKIAVTEEAEAMLTMSATLKELRAFAKMKCRVVALRFFLEETADLTPQK